MEPEAPVPATFNILFVCTGNTCRSPLAEALARREIERRGWQHAHVASAGVAADRGQPASRHAVTVAKRRGLDLASHVSQPLTGELIRWADLVLTMSPSHLQAVASQGGAEKMALLGQFAAPEGERGTPIPDPFGGEEWAYEETLLELDPLIRSSLDRVAPLVHP